MPLKSKKIWSGRRCLIGTIFRTHGLRRSSPSPLSRSGLVMLAGPDDEHLDTYLADPQTLIRGAIMLYKQKNAAVGSGFNRF
jgi:hypothetical protein